MSSHLSLQKAIISRFPNSTDIFQLIGQVASVDERRQNVWAFTFTSTFTFPFTFTLTRKFKSFLDAYGSLAPTYSSGKDFDQTTTHPDPMSKVQRDLLCLPCFVTNTNVTNMKNTSGSAGCDDSNRTPLNFQLLF